MSVYYPLGRTLVTFDDMVEQVATGDLQRFVAAAKERQQADITFAAGTAHAVDVADAFGLSDAQVPFSAIGVKKPLTVEINHVYTGEHRTKDLLVTSAVKSSVTPGVVPRAVNLLTDKVVAGKSFKAVPAVDKGSFVVYHSPAILDRQLNLRVDLSFEDFPSELFESVGGLFGKAAGIPIFAPHSGLLVAAGLITKLIGKIANRIVDRRPEFEADDVIHILQPGHPLADPGFRVLVPDAFGSIEPFEYEKGVLIEKATGNPYSGPHPYIVVSLDGSERPELKDFAPTAASAALLKKYMNLKEGAEANATDLLEALKLVSDIQFRRQATKTQKQMEGLEEDSDKFKDLKSTLDAFNKSILNEDLRLV